MEKSAMIDPGTFAIEEYKAVQEKMKNSRDILNRLETVTIGGAAVALGVLLGIGAGTNRPVPLFAWWAIFLIVVSASIRCSSYYVYILRLQSYLMTIEQSVEGYPLQGFESFNRGNTIGPILAFAASMIMWVAVIGATLFLAIWKSKGFDIP